MSKKIKRDVNRLIITHRHNIAGLSLRPLKEFAAFHLLLGMLT